MIPVTFAPPADLLQDLPGHIPAELGISAWQAGIQDGVNDLPPYTLPEYGELQPLYDAGYAKGDMALRISRLLDSRPGPPGTQEEEAELVPAQWAHNALHAFVTAVVRFAHSLAPQVFLGFLVGFLFWYLVMGA